MTTTGSGAEQIRRPDFRVIFQQCHQFLNKCLINHFLGLALT
ncbi:MAG TPA: hypothetical protein VI542_38740 [Candidatus Tectomicrobia bacterium]